MKTALIVVGIIALLLLTGYLLKDRHLAIGVDPFTCFDQGGIYSKGWCYLPNGQ